MNFADLKEQEAVRFGGIYDFGLLMVRCLKIEELVLMI